MAEVGKHSSPSDCWVVIDGKVYDLTSFRPEHPGGANRIKCGKDMTSAFNGQHGSKELNQISQYSKGALS